jgi:hypothetical protein
MRKTEFANDEFYHIYNRGVDKREVFACPRDYERFLLIMDLLNNKNDGIVLRWRNYKRLNIDATLEDFYKIYPVNESERLVKVVTYCLNPNHFHFELKQTVDGGVRIFMHKIGTSYTNYFNSKYDRTGSLFQGRYKSIHISSNEHLLLLSAYINMNHQIHGYPETDWPYSSLLDYTGRRGNKLCDKEPILGQFDNNVSEYKKYLSTNADYFKEKKEMEKYILE